jgi:alpha 1,3-glucosidase
MTLGISGVTFVGADVGGFFGDPSPELLLRWYQLGAFQPFFRAHAHLDSPRREPWVHGAEWMAKFRSAILSRYQILPYLYTLFYKTSLDGSPVMRPLWFDYPHELDTYTVENQHLLGSDLLVVPVLQDQGRSVEAHVPQGSGNSWVDVSTGLEYGPGKHTINAPLEKIVVLQRGGSIVPRKYRVRRSSAMMVNDPYTLTVALDKKGGAEGELYLDDGDSYNHKVGLYAVRRFSWSKSSDGKSSTLTLIPEGDGRLVSHVEIERVVVFGVDSKPTEVSVSVNGVTTSLEINYDAQTRRLIIRDPNVRVLDSWTISLKH